MVSRSSAISIEALGTLIEVQLIRAVFYFETSESASDSGLTRRDSRLIQSTRPFSRLAPSSRLRRQTSTDPCPPRTFLPPLALDITGVLIAVDLVMVDES
jgi:hypothetical protein